MPAPHSLDGGTDQLPKHMRCAQGQNLHWKERARCSGADGVPRFAWTVERRQRNVNGRPAEAWIALALAICETCPVQWDCTRFALAVQEKYNTWGLDVDDLKWLHKRVDANRIIDIAEDHGVPVQVAVKRVRYRT